MADPLWRGSGQDTPCHALECVDSLAFVEWQEEFALLRQIAAHPNVAKALRVYEPEPASDRLEGVI
eukprot:7041257-Alexandrium_andersonii.AAC.1